MSNTLKNQRNKFLAQCLILGNQKIAKTKNTQQKTKHMGRPKENKLAEQTPLANPVIDVPSEVSEQKPKPPKRPVQTEIPGTQGKIIPAIDEARDEYVAYRDEHKTVTTNLTNAKIKLSALMHKHASDIGADANGTICYRHGDLAVVLEKTEEKLRVKRMDDEDSVVVSGAPKDNSEG